MIPLSLVEVAEIVGGTRHGDPVVVNGPVDVDSRRLDVGGLFVAIPGERVDGHDFVGAAAAAGAVAVLGSRPTALPTVVVDDAVAGLGRLAQAVVRRLPDLRVTALTGSQGKTSTKDLLAAVLETGGPTVATSGNFNNEIGVPLTALRAGAATRHLVLEMGARHLGNIAYLCGLARPHVGLVLNVGTAHLGEFGSREAIAQTKGEIVEALAGDGVAVLNADDDLVAAMATRTRASVLTFGSSARADVRIADLALDDHGRARFALQHAGRRADCRLRVVGAHQAGNAAAAAAVAVAHGLDLDVVAAVLSEATGGSRWRMELHEVPFAGGTVTVLNDAYNANPESMRAAVAALLALGRDHPRTRRIAVLGEMLELGDDAVPAHRDLGRHVVDSGVDVLLAVGPGARPVYDGAADAPGGAATLVAAADHDEAVAWLTGQVRPGDVVLFKGSRGAAMEVVAERLEDHMREKEGPGR